MGGHPQPDGSVHYLRWVPTSNGLALGVNDCASCHTRQLPDGTQLNGAQFDDGGDGVLGALVSTGDERFFGESPSMVAWRSFAVPWVENDIHEKLKSMTPEEVGNLAATPPGTFARFNGSPFFPTQVPDLAGIKDRKYIDHTATHLLRGPEDISRYAILVSCCDPGGFGPHQMLNPTQRKVRDRLTDDVAFALGKYLIAGACQEPAVGGCASGIRERDLHARRMRRVPYPTALHQQQADAGERIHGSARSSQSFRYPARFGRHRSQPCAQNAQGNGTL